VKRIARLPLFGPLLLAPALLACNCATSVSVCDEVKISDAVFIGTVESVSDWRTDLDSAKTPDELQAILKKHLSEENHATLKIKAVFRREGDEPGDDDDDDDKKAKLAPGHSIEVWTDTGECEVEFRKGETYLVYAFEEEQSGRLETNRCSRTIRLTDAGEDMAYLFFYKNGGPESARVEGFTSSDFKTQLNQDRLHYSGSVESAVSNVEIELRSAGGSRYTRPNPNGRFVFDGVPDGDYRLLVYPLEYSANRAPVATSPMLHVKQKSCHSVVLAVPAAPPQH